MVSLDVLWRKSAMSLVSASGLAFARGHQTLSGFDESKRDVAPARSSERQFPVEILDVHSEFLELQGQTMQHSTDRKGRDCSF
jgi:hypothetical protein